MDRIDTGSKLTERKFLEGMCIQVDVSAAIDEPTLNIIGSLPGLMSNAFITINNIVAWISEVFISAIQQKKYMQQLHVRYCLSFTVSKLQV